jgi:hypothetical protein
MMGVMELFENSMRRLFSAFLSNWLSYACDMCKETVVRIDLSVVREKGGLLLEMVVV